MLNTVATVIAVALGVHIVAKFAFFALPYRRRRAAIDKQYGNKPHGSAASDVAPMVLTALIALILLVRGIEAVSFLGGLWIGATIIQLYFHQYHRPVAPERAAPPQTSPLKQMSYAIQDAPWRAWPQMAALSALVVFSVVVLAIGA